MALPHEYLQFLDNDLVKTSAFTSFPLSILLILLEALIDKDFSCPCNAEQNGTLIKLIFIAPCIFVFGLMCILQLNKNGPTRSRRKIGKHFLFTLIPPFVWIMLVLLDGDYIACQKTDWNGAYVSDDQQHVKWCQPTEPVPGKNETELQALTISFIAKSQTSGFVMLLVLGIILIVVVFCVYRCTGEEPPQTTEDRGDYMGTFACYRSEANLPLQLDFE